MVFISMRNILVALELVTVNVVTMLEPTIRIVWRTVKVYFTSLIKIMFKSVCRLVGNSFFIKDLLINA